MFNSFSDPRYTQICSERTLQTNYQGFFLSFADTVIDQVGETWITNVFGKLSNDRERIQKIYEDEKINVLVTSFLGNVQEVYRKKDLKVAEQRFKEAQKCEDNTKSVGLYSQSILKSHERDEIYTSALLGRAKKLIVISKFKKALTDIQMVIKTKPSDNLKGELFSLMAICYKGLGINNKVDIAINLAKQFSININDLLATLHRTPSRSKCEDEIKPIPHLSRGNHSELKSLSAKIILRKSEDLGRYIVTGQEIKTGEVLAVEEAEVACLLPEKFGTHCHHCLERLISPIGCTTCSSIAFCSPDCQASALNTYHKYECKFLDLIIGSGMSILSQTALRIITRNSLDKSLKNYNSTERTPLYNLCTNSTLRTSKDFLYRTLMAVFLLRCLQKSGYFKSSDIIPKDEEYDIGAMLLFNLQMLQFNAHEIYETLYTKEKRLKENKQVYIGVAVYPNVALFNHDCNPGVTRHFVGKHIILHSIRPLQVGETVAENYGPHFAWKNLKERQRSLIGRYWFNCKCDACLQDWPKVNEGLENFPKRVRCTSQNCTNVFTLPVIEAELFCSQCQKKVSLHENITKLKLIEEKFEKGLNLLDKNEKEEGITVLAAAIDNFYKISVPPHRDAHLAQEALRLCLADGGNSWECIRVVK